MSKQKYLVQAESQYRRYYYDFFAENSEDAINQFLKKKNTLRKFFTSIKAIKANDKNL